MKDILSQIVILTTNITLWSGRKRLKEEDLKLVDGSQLPPAALASLGSKKVMDPAALAVFERLKRRAEREILGVGSRFLNGYAVPKTRLKELMPKLAAIEQEFEAAKAEFLSEYDVAVESWIQANPGWEDVIRGSVENLAYVSRQLSFSIQTFNISPHRSHRQGLEKEIGGLAEQLRQEVGQMARTCWEASFEGKVEVGQRAIRPLRAMVDKVEGLVFLEPGLNELVAGIKSILETMPATGPVKGADFAALCGALHLLGDIPAAATSVETLLEEDPSPVPLLPIPATRATQPTPVQWF